MPRTSRTFQMGGVNVVLHPHSPARYVALWKKLYALERAVRVRGDTYAMIGTINPVSADNPAAGFVGSIFKFTKIDKDADWIDLRSAKQAAPETIEKEVRIPDYLQPNLRTFQYYFDPRRHRAVIETKNNRGTFSPTGFETMLTRLLDVPEIREEFSDAEATVEQSREVMRSVLRKGGLKHLRILVKRPNPDDGEEDARKVLAELSAQEARKMVTELHAQSGKTLAPDARTQLLAKVATSNGSVEGTVVDDEGRPVPVSSREHPFRLPFTIRHGQAARDAFVNAAACFVRKLFE